MKTNTYGLTMTGLRTASTETKSLQGYYSGRSLQISYNVSTGDILTNYHVDHNDRTVYEDHDIIIACHAVDPMTQQQIADAIHEALVRREA